jgi:hypothetical protein
MVGVKGDTEEIVEIGVIFPSSDWEEERSLAHLISWAQEDINQYMEENGQGYRFEFLIENAEASEAEHLDRVMNLHLNGVARAP